MHNIHIQTPEGPYTVSSLMLASLIEAGVVVQDANGQYIATSAEDMNKWTSEKGFCDFCSSPEVTHTVLVPDFTMPVEEVGADGIRRNVESTGGWAACTPCYELVQENRRSDLLRRSVDSMGGHNKFTISALRLLHGKFWTAYDTMVNTAGVVAAFNDFIEDRIPTFEPKIKNRDKRVEAIRRMTGLTPAEMDAFQKGDVLYNDIAEKIGAWMHKYNANKPGSAERLIAMLDEATPPMPKGTIPHWQVAVDSKFETMELMQHAVDFGTDYEKQFVYASTESTDLNDPTAVEAMMEKTRSIRDAKAQVIKMGYAEDVAHLKIAEVYSFNAETMHAIRDGARSIPHESPLSAVDIPRITAGWFWFAEPFPVSGSPMMSEVTAALLWGWVKEGKSIDGQVVGPVLRFSAYIKDEKGQMEGKIMPSVKWYWPLTYTFHEMVAFNIESYRHAYGPGGVHEHEPMNVGEDQTIKVVVELSLFFLMACVWFKQRVLVEVPPKDGQKSHLERHRRKQLQREYKLPELPTVRVIALRKALRTAVDVPAGGVGTGHAVKVRFIVAGHARLQACGPGMKDRKLIWIDPYPKGPEGAPFKERGSRVFAVVR